MKLTEVYIIKEAKCPLCGDDDAYIGFNSVECTNNNCKNFSQKHYNDLNQKLFLTDAKRIYNEYKEERAKGKRFFVHIIIGIDEDMFESYETLDEIWYNFYVHDESNRDYIKDELTKRGCSALGDNQLYDTKSKAGSDKLEKDIKKYTGVSN